MQNLQDITVVFTVIRDDFICQGLKMPSYRSGTCKYVTEYGFPEIVACYIPYAFLDDREQCFFEPIYRILCNGFIR